MASCSDAFESLTRFEDFAPTGFDAKGLGSRGQEDWRVVVGTNRDADTLTRSNWEVITADIAKFGEEARECGVSNRRECVGDWQIHRFGHWACGWFEILVVRPGTKCAEEAGKWIAALDNYPLADEDHHSDLEYREACEFWASMRTKERIDYIRNSPAHEFEFSDMADLVACVRGRYFKGYASELLA